MTMSHNPKNQWRKGYMGTKKNTIVLFSFIFMTDLTIKAILLNHNVYD